MKIPSCFLLRQKTDRRPRKDRPINIDRNEVLNDPTVQMVLKGLDATPVDIRKMTIEEPEEQTVQTEEEVE